jgi:type II restriction enzyme
MENERVTYTIDDDNIIICRGNEEKLIVNTTDFKKYATLLLCEIKRNNGAFPLPIIEDFMRTVKCTKVKANSTDKADIRIVIHDIQSQRDSLLGFSIKSQLGNSSTLVNPGATTKFTYEIVGREFTNDEISSINSINTKAKIRDRIAKIQNLGGRFRFENVNHRIFRNNLLLLDASIPQIIAELLLLKNTTSYSDIRSLCTILETNNPLDFDLDANPYFYSYKIKHFLLEAALGFVPAKVWDGKYDANGGYIIVKDDGDIVCYHIYNKNLFDNYLFSNTIIENPSSTRYDFGCIEKKNGKYYFQLCLQVRFKK